MKLFLKCVNLTKKNINGTLTNLFTFRFRSLFDLRCACEKKDARLERVFKPSTSSAHYLCVQPLQPAPFYSYPHSQRR